MARPVQRVLLCCALWCALVCGRADADIIAARHLPADYTAGGTFIVTVVIQGDASLSPGLIIRESLPSGWQATRVTGNFSDHKLRYDAETGTYQYSWLTTSTINLPFTFSYEVAVPPGETGARTLRGSILMKLSTGELREIETGGDITIRNKVSSASISLAAGWNLISLPVEPVTGCTAQDFLTLINQQGGAAVEIDQWRNSTWEGHINNLPFGNFDMVVGGGYFVRCTAPSTVTVEGTPVASVSLSLSAGWNLVGIPCGTYGAQAVLEQIGRAGGAAVEIDRWHNSTWEGHIKDLPFGEFTIEAGQGYFIKCTGACVVSF